MWGTRGPASRGFRTATQTGCQPVGQGGGAGGPSPARVWDPPCAGICGWWGGCCQASARGLHVGVGVGDPGPQQPPHSPAPAGRLPLQHRGLRLDRRRLHSRGPEVHPARAGEVSLCHHTRPAGAALRRRRCGEAAGPPGTRVLCRRVPRVPLVLPGAVSPLQSPRAHAVRQRCRSPRRPQGPQPGVCSGPLSPMSPRLRLAFPQSS